MKCSSSIGSCSGKCHPNRHGRLLPLALFVVQKSGPGQPDCVSQVRYESYNAKFPTKLKPASPILLITRREFFTAGRQMSERGEGFGGGERKRRRRWRTRRTFASGRPRRRKAALSKGYFRAEAFLEVGWKFGSSELCLVTLRISPRTLLFSGRGVRDQRYLILSTVQSPCFH